MLKKTLLFRIIFLLLCLLSLGNIAYGQSYKQRFNELYYQKDTLGQLKLLEEWEKADKNNAELYIARFNYYANNSRKEIVRLDSRQPQKGEALQVSDSSGNEAIAYMYGETYYVPEILQKGFDAIEEGITRHPDRLDMRFGKVFMYGESGDYEAFTAEIIRTIDYSGKNKNKWTWTDNEKVDDASFLLNAIQDYQVQLYEMEDDRYLEYMKQIAEAILKLYPEHIESLSNLSIVYLLRKDYDKALEPLLKAEKLEPKDYIVLSNIAQAYKLKGDCSKAIKYYKLTVKYGDEASKNYAEQQIRELKEKCGPVRD